MVKAKVFVLARQFDGYPTINDFKIIEEELPPIQDGEFLAEAVYLSVDPYMVYFGKVLPVGTCYPGAQVAKITESKNPKFPVGKYFCGSFGWRTHTISKGETKYFLGRSIAEWIVSDLGNLPLSLSLGILGMPGKTAYFGFLDICQPKEGETVVVSGAAGAVGNVVGQIAKIKGCKVIGIAGSDVKTAWLKDTLKFDHVINYKKANIDKALQEVAPEGVDCYFDNVAGEISSTVVKHMKRFGRISLCGSVSQYSEKNPPKVTSVNHLLVANEIKMEGFTVSRFDDRHDEAINQLKEWIDQGKLVYQETVTEGFKNMATAFIDMLNGGNTGKAVIKV